MGTMKIIIFCACTTMLALYVDASQIQQRGDKLAAKLAEALSKLGHCSKNCGRSRGEHRGELPDQDKGECSGWIQDEKDTTFKIKQLAAEGRDLERKGWIPKYRRRLVTE